MLSVHPLNETAVIVDALTKQHGRHAGVVHGGASARRKPVLQSGNSADLEWRGRLQEHIGSYRIDITNNRIAALLHNRYALAAVRSMCALLVYALPEHEPNGALYDGTANLLDCLMAEQHYALRDNVNCTWPVRYVHWEALLLQHTGFGLNLSVCAVSGAQDNLVYVSPRTGRAINKHAAGKWASRLLPCPPCLRTHVPAILDDVLAGLQTTGYFLEHKFAVGVHRRSVPNARAWLLSELAKANTKAHN